MIRRLAFGSLLLLFIALVVSGCDSLAACKSYYGDRLLPGEKVPVNGVPTELVSACMYGADTVAPQVVHQNVDMTELCQAQYNVNALDSTADPTQRITKVLQLNEACTVAVHAYIHANLFPDSVFDPEECKAMRGKNGISPQLPCE